MKKYDTLCLSGGGILGLSFIGTIEYLEKKQIINNLESKITNFAGTSVGSMVCFILSLGYTIKELKETILKFNIKKLIPEVNVENLLMNHGVDNGDKIKLIMISFLKEKVNVSDITFEDLYKLTNNKLTIVGTNFSKGIEVAYNYILTPKMSVITAIRISISVPIMFTPVFYENEYYIDGGIYNNFPLNYCNKESTLGIYIKNGSCNQLDNIFSLMLGTINIISDTISNKHCSNLNNCDIIEIQNNKKNITNFDIDINVKLDLIKMGIIAAKQFLKSIQV